MIAAWPCPGGEELALALDRGRSARLLILPALFDEGNKLRHFTAQTMRLLGDAGIDSFLPDLPGCNESVAPLAAQTLAGWRAAARAAAAHFAATHVLAIRAGALIAPALPGWCYAPQEGPAVLRTLLRARLLAGREAGRTETAQELMAIGIDKGLNLLGYSVGPQMFRELQTATLSASPGQSDIAPADLGGPGLWLRAEPDHDPAQATALAALIAGGIGA